MGCWNTNCSAGDGSFTCAARIKTLHGDITLWNKANNLQGDEHRDFICHSAVRMTKSKCDSCALCDAEEYCEGGLNLGCQDGYCSYAGVGDTCGNRFIHAMLNDPKAKASQTPCETAVELVKEGCPTCGGCSAKWFCAQQGAMAPRPASALPESHETQEPDELEHSTCSSLCQQGGVSASCGDRINWAMTNNNQISLSSHPCLAAGELVQSQCPVCGKCSAKWFCSQQGQQQASINVMFKYASVAADGFLARTGFMKPMSMVPLLACIVTGIAFVSLLRRRRNTQGSARVVADEQSLDDYVDPLCPVSDDQEGA